jgi:hypothetical protein
MDLRKYVPASVPAFYLTYKIELPIICLVIVAATFMAHDYFREDAKDLADSLHRANDIFQMREEVHSEDMRIGQILNLVEQVNKVVVPTNAIKKTADEEKFINFFRVTFDADETAQLSDERQLKNVKDLLERMPYDADLKDEMEKVEKALIP